MTRNLTDIDRDLARLKAERKALRPLVFKPGIRSRSFRPEGDGQRQPRRHDNAHLAWIRRLPCIAAYVTTGRMVYGCQAAHLRMSSARHGKSDPGMGRKPDDMWTLPLTPEAHRIQGDVKGEARFWRDLGVDPFTLCQRLHAYSGDDAAGHDVIRTLRAQGSTQSAGEG